MSRAAWALLLLVGTALVNSVAAEDFNPADGSRALAERLRAATAEVDANPRDPQAYRSRAALYAAAGEHKRAIADYDEVIALDPDAAEAYDQRGSQHFMLGRIAESIDDFDRFIKLRPQQAPWHWKRGISYYYAGRFDDGRRQFEGYQTVDDTDVENAVWRYLCMARSAGVPAARDAMLPIKRDPRVPMMEVYALYSGKAQSDDVLAAARAAGATPAGKNAALFYAHFYLGLYHEAAGDVARAREHISTAAEKHKIGHYMWNVADVHARRLRQAAKP